MLPEQIPQTLLQAEVILAQVNASLIDFTLDRVDTRICVHSSITNTGLLIAQLGIQNEYDGLLGNVEMPRGFSKGNHFFILNLPISQDNLARFPLILSKLKAVIKSMFDKIDVFGIILGIGPENYPKNEAEIGDFFLNLIQSQITDSPHVKGDYHNQFLVDVQANDYMRPELMPLITAARPGNTKIPFPTPSQTALRNLYLTLFDLDPETNYSTAELMQAAAVYMILKRMGKNVELSPHLCEHEITKAAGLSLEVGPGVELNIEFIRRFLGTERIVIANQVPDDADAVPSDADEEEDDDSGQSDSDYLRGSSIDYGSE